MRQWVLSSAAAHDIESILVWTQEHFGELARVKYEALLVQAILDLADDARRAGSVERSEIIAGARTYHLRHSRSNMTSVRRVRRPRHFMLYRILEGDRVEIGRVLHDSMDIDRHLPEEYRGNAP